MSNYSTTFEIGDSMAVSLPADVYVVANPSEIDRLQAGTDMRRLAEFQSVALPPSEPIPADVIAKAFLLVIEVDPSDRVSMRRIAQVRNARPNLPLVVALHEANVAAVRTLVRQGVNDVATIPFDLEELSSQLLDLAAQVRNDATAQLPLSPLVSVVRSTGGSGATTVVTHLAAALAAQSGRPSGSCLIDLDIQFGNVAASLGKSAKTSVIDLLEAGDRLDAEFFASAAVDSGRGFDIVVAPKPITPLETVDVDQLIHLLSIARRAYGSVLVDFPANWTNWTLSTALASTDLVLITDLTIPGLRQAKRRLELFDTVGVPRERIRIVVNRVEKRLFKTIGIDEVRATLGQSVFATLAAESNILRSAQDQGLLAWEAHRKSQFAADISVLAEQLAKEWRA